MRSKETADPAGAPPLYRAAVPVLVAVVDRIGSALDLAEAQLGARWEEALAARPAPGMLPAGQQAATAMQFTLRVAFPLAGLKVPEPRHPVDARGLRSRAAETRALLGGLDPAAFAGAAARIVRGQAGFAEVAMPGDAFLWRFGLPNVYFHHAMAHVALKQAGAALGKADFDGVHVYPEGFSFG